MARKPQGVRWERSGHTEAKHSVLRRYLDAWIPILATQTDDLVIIDGFAGPGRYEGGEPGSPLILLDAYARRADRQQLAVTAHYFFIEADEARHAALKAELTRRKPVADIEVEAIHGDYDEEFPAVLRRVRREWPKAAVFAFIDPFGGQHKKLELTHDLLRLPKCEALIFAPIGYFGDFFDVLDMRRTLEVVFGEDALDAGKGMSASERKQLLVARMEKRLKESCRWVRAFELVPARGGRSHYLFFGTNSKVGLARMKESMWKIDPVGGQRFRDSTRPGQSVLFEEEPDLTPLGSLLRERFGTAEFTIEDAQEFTLFETPFRHDAHLKRPTLAPMEREGLLVPPADQKRRKNSYPAGTKLRFAPPDD